MNLADTIKESKIIRENYELYAIKDWPLSIDFYLLVIQQYTEYKISLQQVKPNSRWKSSNIRGMVHRFNAEKIANIYIAREKAHPNDPFGVTFCEHRFIATKEACHLLIDNEDTQAKSAKILIESLLYNLPHTVDAMPQEYQSEIHAIVAALELLFPWETRDTWKDMIDRQEKTFLDAAKLHRIPERWVYWVLSDKAHPAISEVHRSM